MLLQSSLQDGPEFLIDFSIVWFSRCQIWIQVLLCHVLHLSRSLGAVSLSMLWVGCWDVIWPLKVLGLLFLLLLLLLLSNHLRQLLVFIDMLRLRLHLDLLDWQQELCRRVKARETHPDLHSLCRPSDHDILH